MYWPATACQCQMVCGMKRKMIKAWKSMNEVSEDFGMRNTVSVEMGQC